MFLKVLLRPTCRRLFSLALLSMAVLGTTGAQAAQGNAFSPAKPVTIIVPFAAGGPNDAIARVLGQALSTHWRQTVVVENRPGASGLTGVSVASRSPPDGYTLVVATNVLTFPILSKAVTIKPREDVVPISILAGGPLLIAAPADSRFRNAKEAFAFAASHPGEFSMATLGLTLSHLDASYLFYSTLKAQPLFVPYNSAAQAVQALAAGQVDSYMSAVPSIKAMVESGRLTVLGIASNERDPRLPQAPTFKEQGIAFEAGYWIGLYGPKGLSRENVKRIASDVMAVFDSAEVREKVDRLGMSPMAAGPEQMIRQMDAEERRYREAARFTQRD